MKSELKQEKEIKLKNELEEVKKNLNESEVRYLQTAQEKGASAWLNCLPIQSLGYSLNKQEFRDAIHLRYGWKIQDMPNECGCGKKNSIDHSLICKLGGYVSLTHNSVRDTQAQIMKEICYDVWTEPQLQPVANPEFNRRTTSSEDQARLDISAKGLNGRHARTFFDIRITHPGAASNKDKSLEQLYRQHEEQKKNLYNERILQIEKSSFSPLVFTTSGGMAPECRSVNKKLASMIAQKRKEEYSKVISHIRTRLRFALLRSSLAAIRGERGRRNHQKIDELSDIQFGLIPELNTYETY